MHLCPFWQVARSVGQANPLPRPLTCLVRRSMWGCWVARLHHGTATPRHGYTSTQLHLDTATPRHNYTTARLHHGMATPQHGYTSPQLHHGTAALWHGYTMAQLHHGTTNPWHNHTMAQPRHGVRAQQEQPLASPVAVPPLSPPLGWSNTFVGSPRHPHGDIAGKASFLAGLLCAQTRRYLRACFFL